MYRRFDDARFSQVSFVVIGCHRPPHVEISQIKEVMQLGAELYEKAGVICN